MKRKDARIGLLLFLVLALSAGSTEGAVTISKAVIIDKDQNTEVSFGYADADLNVYFKGDGSCYCDCPNLSYRWYFGDGTSASGKTASHSYAGGTHNARFKVSCSGCGDYKYSGYKTVYAISGVVITLVGDADLRYWLCFNAYVTCEAETQPSGVPGSHLIDWSLLVGTYEIEKPNQSSTSMTLPVGQWPTYNSFWGTGQTLYCSIDGPHVPNQNDELITGAASYIYHNVPVTEFYDGNDPNSQNPSPYPNWFYYWEQTSADYGTLYWHDATAETKYINGEWRAHLGPGDNDPYTPPEGDNGGSQLKFIDDFAWTARHEGRHVTLDNGWWPSGHGGYVSPADWTNDADHDFLPDGQEAALGGTQQNPVNGGPFDPAVYNTDGDGTGKDNEDYICNTQSAWTEGDADDEDWAHPGKQWE